MRGITVEDGIDAGPAKGSKHDTSPRGKMGTRWKRGNLFPVSGKNSEDHGRKAKAPKLAFGREKEQDVQARSSPPKVNK